jgi:hypothetical protein
MNEAISKIHGRGRHHEQTSDSGSEGTANLVNTAIQLQPRRIAPKVLESPDRLPVPQRAWRWIF